MPYSIFHIEGGIGKNIVATNVVRNIKKAYPERDLIVVSPYPEVFLHNPNIYRTYKIGNCPFFYEDFIKDKDALVFKHNPYNTNGVINRKENLAEAWCNCFNLKLDKVKPELFFNKIEQQNSQILIQNVNDGKPVIAVQINGGVNMVPNSINFSWFRDLPPMYAAKLIGDFKKDFNFVQVRHSGQMQLENVKQLNLSIREVLLFLSQIKGALCIDSFVQHAMASFDKPSAVCWVGNSSNVFGYNIHKNIKSNLELKGCDMESYLEQYPLISQGYRCPTDYAANTLFDYNQIKTAFEELYC